MTRADPTSTPTDPTGPTDPARPNDPARPTESGEPTGPTAASDGAPPRRLGIVEFALLAVFVAIAALGLLEVFGPKLARLAG
jgi:hypothetical protein